MEQIGIWVGRAHDQLGQHMKKGGGSVEMRCDSDSSHNAGMLCTEKRLCRPICAPVSRDADPRCLFGGHLVRQAVRDLTVTSVTVTSQWVLTGPCSSQRLRLLDLRRCRRPCSPHNSDHRSASWHALGARHPSVGGRWRQSRQISQTLPSGALDNQLLLDTRLWP